MRTAEEWFSSYSRDHQNAKNRSIHWVCVPAILWAVIAALWTIPVPSAVGLPGLWCWVAMAAALAFYFRMSKMLGVVMFGLFAVLGLLTNALYWALGPGTLLAAAVVVFVAAWVGQFIGHIYEGRRPSFFTDLSYLMVGPAWLVSKLMRSAGLAY
jgi:uncharacterized membrane protein YGL010W